MTYGALTLFTSTYVRSKATRVYVVIEHDDLYGGTYTYCRYVRPRMCTQCECGVSHKSSDWPPLLSLRPAVTKFPATQHHHSLASIKLYCWASDALELAEDISTVDNKLSGGRLRLTQRIRRRTCPGSLHDSGTAGSQTHNLPIKSPRPYRLSHQATLHTD